MYFLIGIWGGGNRLYSAIKFFLYTLVGSVVMLLGILALYFYNHSVSGVYTFDVTQFQTLSVPYNLQWWCFLAFLPRVSRSRSRCSRSIPGCHDAHTRCADGRLGDSGAVLLKMGHLRVPPASACRSCRKRRGRSFR
jgi:hypothetical protein